MNTEQLIAQSVSEVPPSGIRKFFDIASDMKNVISMSVGEPDFVTPWNVCQAAIDSIERGETHYTSNSGMPELRALIEQYLAERFRVHYKPEQMLVTVGASEALDLAFRALLNPGDEVLIPAPSYVSYEPGVRFAHGVSVPIVTEEQDDFVIRPENIERAITPKTKLLVIPYPNNPTGAVLSAEDIVAIQSVALKHDLFVIADEIYAELTYGRDHVSFAEGFEDRTLLINGFSKAFAMTGWRLGYVCAPPAIDEAIFKIHQYSILCAPITAQYAAVEALKDGFSDDFAAVEEMRDSYDRRRRFVVDSLRGAGLSCFSPRGAFYAFPSVKNTSLSGEDFANLLLKEQKVAVVPGSAFGTFGRDNVRISYATGMTALTEACGRISEFMSKFR